MFLIDMLREQLPRSLKCSEILIATYLVGGTATVTFRLNRGPVELKVDSERGLTEVQRLHLCAVL
jgi:hypothetical protein